MVEMFDQLQAQMLSSRVNLPYNTMGYSVTFLACADPQHTKFRRDLAISRNSLFKTTDSASTAHRFIRPVQGGGVPWSMTHQS